MSKEVITFADAINKGNAAIDKKTAIELVEVIGTLVNELEVRTSKFVEKGNKSAAKDARKVTLALERVFKAFRKASVA